MEVKRLKVKPTKKQFKALMLLLEDNWVSFLWYGWAAWWWKTILAALWISMMCSKYEWVRYWVFRRYITDALDTTFTSFSKALWIIGLKEANTVVELMKPWTDFDYVVTNWGKEIRFWNWSEIWFRWLQDKPTDIHFTKIWWLELTWAFVDEANECPELWISTLKKRVWRHLNIEFSIPRKVLCTFNPDKWWVYRTFYLPFKTETELEDTKFIPALPIDNHYLSQEYVDELRNEKNEVLRQRLYHWNFDFDNTPGRLFDYVKILDLDKPKIPYNKTRFISCDAARKWKDTCIIIVWEWFNKIDITVFDKCTTMQISEEIRRLQNLHWVDNQNTIVDEDWVWWWVVDELWCIWFINNSSPISPYWSKNNNYLKRNYANLKTQCYFELARVVNDNLMYVSLDTGAFNRLCEELDIVVQVDIDKDSKIKIISKEDIKEKLWRSPDYSDTLMMRCYFNLVYWWIQYEDEEVIETKKRQVIYDWFDTLEDIMEMEVEYNDNSII